MTTDFIDWDRGFDSHQRHGHFFRVFALCCDVILLPR